MRTSDIAYVKNGTNNSKPVPPLESMDLRDIVKRYLVTCVKSQGRVSECMKCNEKCTYGIRAVNLATGVINSAADPTMPYEGSILQQARIHNNLERKRQMLLKDVKEEKEEIEGEIRQLEKKMSEARKEDKAKKRKSWKDWFEDSLKADDQVSYVMERFNVSKTQAKNRIYQTLHTYEEARQLKEKYHPSEETEEQKKNKPDVKQVVVIQQDNIQSDPEDDLMKKVMERKLESLMNKQEEYESVIKEYQAKLNKVKEQIDTICKTMDILKDGD